MRSHEYFEKYIDSSEVILPARPDLTTKKDLCFKNFFTRYMAGSLSSSNLMGNDNQFLYLENLGISVLRVNLINILLDDVMSFAEELMYEENHCCLTI